VSVRALKFWGTLAIGPLLFLSGKWALRTYDEYMDKRAVEAAVLARFGEEAGARVIDIGSNEMAICGWAVPGRGRPALAFHAPRLPKKYEVHPLIPLRDEGGALERARAARMWNLVRDNCRSALPPAPDNAFADPVTDRAVDQLDQLGVDWVVVRPAGTDQYVVLGRRGALSPKAFSSSQDADSWVAEQRARQSAEGEAFRRCYAMPASAAQDVCLREAR
jgi:hypothetical protein